MLTANDAEFDCTTVFVYWYCVKSLEFFLEKTLHECMQDFTATRVW